MIGLASAGPALAGQPEAFTICEKQRYALCATASCIVYNAVAYCTCELEKGDSISEPFTIPAGDICEVNRQGPRNGYLMSTYSLPSSVLAGGDQALYTCPGATSDGAYAQCDGGFCFASTRGQRFPGGTGRLKRNEIVCSCPITVADPGAGGPGYQFVGPYPCQEKAFEACSKTVANTQTGSTIHVGAPTGSARVLTQGLYGSVPELNHCEPVP